jgi:pimeloyl-ACP methyl ester carboxylesterase
MEDMVNDALAVLDSNNIKQAHVVGYSMGGYIGQRIAINYSERILSLTSLSSSADLSDTNHPKFNWTPSPVIKLALRALIIRSDRNFLKALFKFFEHINGEGAYPIELRLLGERGLYELHKRRGFNTSAKKHQMAAGKNLKSNYEELHKIKVPTLVAHGEKDPVLSIALAKHYVSLLKDSKHIWIEGTGHVMTNYYIDKILPDLISVFEKGSLPR